eukprot:g11018.t1
MVWLVRKFVGRFLNFFLKKTKKKRGHGHQQLTQKQKGNTASNRQTCALPCTAIITATCRVPTATFHNAGWCGVPSFRGRSAFGLNLIGNALSSAPNVEPFLRCTCAEMHVDLLGFSVTLRVVFYESSPFLIDEHVSPAIELTCCLCWKSQIKQLVVLQENLSFWFKSCIFQPWWASFDQKRYGCNLPRVNLAAVALLPSNLCRMHATLPRVNLVAVPVLPSNICRMHATLPRVNLAAVAVNLAAVALLPSNLCRMHATLPRGQLGGCGVVA